MLIKPNKVFNIVFTVIVLLLALPASAILATWNSLPGDMLYPVKRSLEKTALALTPSSLLESKLHFAFLDRRVKEASIALIQQPNDQQILDNILTEAIAAQVSTTNLNPDQQTTSTLELIQKINQASEQLDQAKTEITYSLPILPKPQVTTPTQPTIITTYDSKETSPTIITPKSSPLTSTSVTTVPETPPTSSPSVISTSPSSTPSNQNPNLVKIQTSADSITQTQKKLNQIVAKAEQHLESQSLKKEHQEKLKQIKQEHREKMRKNEEDYQEKLENKENETEEKSSKKQHYQDDD